MCKRVKAALIISPVLALASTLWGPSLQASTIPYDARPFQGKTANPPKTPADVVTSIFGKDDNGKGKNLQKLMSSAKDKHGMHIDWNTPSNGHKHGDKDRDGEWHDGTHCDDQTPDPGDIVTDPGTDGTPGTSGNPDGNPTPSAVPLPPAVWLMVSGILGLGVTGVRRRRF